MNNLLRLSVVMLSLGMLGAAGCSSCAPAEETAKPEEYKQSFTCGAGTVRQGNQCVGTAGASPRAQPTAIPASGNN